MSNLSNFRSFGGTKFLPRCPAEAFAAVVGASERSEVALSLWDKVSRFPHLDTRPVVR